MSALLDKLVLYTVERNTPDHDLREKAIGIVLKGGYEFRSVVVDKLDADNKVLSERSRHQERPPGMPHLSRRDCNGSRSYSAEIACRSLMLGRVFDGRAARIGEARRNRQPRRVSDDDRLRHAPSLASSTKQTEDPLYKATKSSALSLKALRTPCLINHASPRIAFQIG
jgi:hypothetical protein